MSNNVSDILVPNLPESVVDATVAVWHKKEGDQIQQDEILVEIETDKIMLEVPAPTKGILKIILEPEGSIVVSGQSLGQLSINNDNCFKDKISTDQVTQMTECNSPVISKECDVIASLTNPNKDENNDNMDLTTSPAIRKLIVKYNLNVKDIHGSGVKGRITRQDIEEHVQNKQLLTRSDENTSFNIQQNKQSNYDIHNINHINLQNNIDCRNSTRVVMSRLRKKIADRLLNVTNSTAILTTFNEVNMQPIMTLRNQYKELFEKRYNIKLGFMSFYVKAVLEGLRRFPDINASIDGEEIVYYNYFDISIAVSTTRGLVTPVLRNVESLSIPDIEKKIKILAEKGRDGKLTIEELKGGNFTITNGGVFGSLMSTPIINPPQSAILGMHAIKDRPVAVDGKIVILPMMYLALSYDHRLIDGKDSINFLVTVKELIEDPMRLLLSI